MCKLYNFYMWLFDGIELLLDC